MRFVRDCINVAVNRRHEQVREEDILHAERSYSDDALVDLSLELKDVRPDFANAPYAFIGSDTRLLTSEVTIGLMKSGIQVGQIEKSGSSCCGSGLLRVRFGHVLPLLGLAVPARSGLVVHAGVGIHHSVAVCRRSLLRGACL